MNRKSALSTVLCFLLIGTLMVTLNVKEAKGAGTIYIRADGSVDPPSAPISTLDMVTYIFTADIFDETIVIERDNIVVDGEGHTLQGTFATDSRGIYLFGRTNVNITHMTINQFTYGVYLRGSSSCTVLGNNITNNFEGIRLDSSSGNYTVSGNNMTNNFYGVSLAHSHGSTVSGNNITNSVCGVVLTDSSGNTISGNIFVDGGLLVSYSYGNVVVDNVVNGKPLVYLEGVSDVSVGDAGQVILVSCNRIQVKNLNLSYTFVGAELWNTNNSAILGNNITDNGYYGVIIDYSSGNTVSGNNITNNGHFGVAIFDSSANTVSGNNITNNDYGVYIYIYASSGNRFFHNNFVNNDYQVRIPDSGYLNYWDDGYPSGGNYWSDYTGTDGNGDGIGDTPYVIDANNQDRYPLVNPWTEPCGRPVLVSALEITRAGDVLSAGFTIENRGDASIKLDRLLVGGRFNWGNLTSGDYPDFPYVTVTLMQNELYEYNQTMELTEVGCYQFFVAYYIQNPSEQEKNLLDQNNWNTCIDLAEGLTDTDRSISIEKWPAIVIASPLEITPNGPYHTSDLLNARFSVKNIGSTPVNLKVLTVGGRDPDGLPVDFAWETDVNLNPNGEAGDEHVYEGTILLPEGAGNYHFFCTYKASDESWNTCVDLSEGLVDSDRVKDLNALGTEIEYPLGGIIIPEADFPEGAGKAIPIYVPPVIDDSNVIREEGDWHTVKTLTKADWSFDWPKFFSGLTAEGAEVWNPFADDYVPSPRGSVFAVVAGTLQAASGAQSVATVSITIQKNSVGSYRAILQVGDPQRRSLFRANALEGMVSIVPGSTYPEWVMQKGWSDAIAETFKLPKVEAPDLYLPVLLIDRAHENDEYTSYLCLSKDNRIELIPKIYSGDALIFNHWKYHWVFFATSEEVARLKGQGFVDLESNRATDDASKLIQNALAPFALVPESAILLNGGSPCEFRIIDSQGRITGRVNGEIYEEIPNSIYLNDSETIIVYRPTGDLHYDVVGESPGTYRLNLTSVTDWNVTTFTATSIPILNQTADRYTIDWAALSGGEDGVFVQVDANGDGSYEFSFASDSELSRFEYVAATTEHDLGITEIGFSKSIIGQGCTLPINMTIMNYGVYTETFNVTIWANTTLVTTQIVTLANATSSTVTYAWNTTGFAKGNCTISVYAEPVPGETYTADNVLVSGHIIVTIPGDINGDFITDIFDAILLAGTFNYVPSNPNWKPNTDINSDNIVDIFDAIILANHFNQHYP